MASATDPLDDSLDIPKATAEGAEPATKHDVTEGGLIGAVGGAVVGALAGGPIGAVIGAVAGGLASAAAVDVVDKHDHDYTDANQATTNKRLGSLNHEVDYDTRPTPDYSDTPIASNDAAYNPTGEVNDREFVGEERVLPVVQEELVVGKRDLVGDTAHVYSNIVETPVEQPLTLTSEKVTVDRRLVDRPIAVGDLPFQEGVIELEEFDEEPVVTKEARVVEEVIVNKVATDHIETVHDTVKRSDVSIDPTDAGELK